MIIESTTALCKGFAICTGHITANDTYQYSLEDTTTDTKYSQIFYLFDGGGIMYDDNDNEYGRSDVSNAWDLREFHRKKYKFVSGNKGATWVCINPVPANKFFDMELVKSNSQKTIAGDGKEHIILCLKGIITVNGNELTSLKYSRILNGKVADVVVPSGSEAMYLTR